MSNFTSWKEYLSERGKMVEKPEVAKIADYKGPDPSSPEAGEGQKVKGDKKLDSMPNAPKPGKPTPYKPANRHESPKKSGEKGFASTGDSKLVYEPNTDIKGGDNMPGGKLVNGSWPKTKTEAFLDKTNKMTMHEFAKFMLEEYEHDEDNDLPTVTAFTTGKIQPYPPEVIRYIVALAKNNKKILESLIHEMKNCGCMGDMLKSSMNHPEAFDHITDALGDTEEGPKRAGALARSMDSKYSSFLKDQEEMYESDLYKESVAPPFGDPSEGGDEDDERPEEDEDQGTEDQSPEGEEGQDQGPEDQDREPTDDQSPPDIDAEEPQDKEEKPPKKLRKKFAHHHVIDAMKNYDHMKKHMNA
jgi:hypothetical protein